MEQILTQMKKQIESELEEYDQKFREDHKDMLDFGMCGSAVVLIPFGRKRKLKQIFEDHNIISNLDWIYYGRKCSVFNIPIQGVGTQYVGYYEDRAKIVCEIIKQHFPELDAFVHSWVD